MMLLLISYTEHYEQEVMLKLKNHLSNYKLLSLLICFLGNHLAMAFIGEHATVSAGQLAVVKVTKHSLQGEFHSDKTGIRFRSEGSPTSNFLSILSLEGRNIFSSTLLGDGVTLISVMGGDYVILGDPRRGKTKSTVYRMPRTRRRSILKSLMKFGGSVKQLSRAGYLDSRGVAKTSARDIRDLIKSEEAKQIHQTALELGKSGLYGTDSTGSMIFYVLAMRIANIHVHQSVSKLASIHPRHCRVDPDTMLKLVRYKIMAARQGLSLCNNNRQYCKTCPRGNDCLGGCGIGCEDCWEMVCGDCCYHRGCFGYNVCDSCRGDQLSLACFNVFGFQCDSTYTC